MKKRYYILFLLLPVLVSCKSFNEKREIKEAFRKWKENEIKIGVDYLSKENCNEVFVSKDSLRSVERPRLTGFPDDIEFSYGYLNNDDKIDALVTFLPVSCEGARALRWVQIRLLIISSDNGYKLDSTFFNTIIQNSKGYIILDKIKNKCFEGDYYEYAFGDPNCCPSIHKRVLVDYKTKNVFFE